MPEPEPTDPSPSLPARRIVVVGTTGSGKTTLAGQIARRLRIPHVELDALHWDPGWTAAPTDVFRERVARALAGDVWVVDGNYGKVREVIWDRAEQVIWLDYSLPRILLRLVRRTVARVARRTELWNGNRERLLDQLGRDSIILWALQTHGRRRRDYEALSANPEYAHLRIVRLRSPRETRRWLSGVERHLTAASSARGERLASGAHDRL